ncbi:MAG TPA: C1 family peptidase [Candidatus Saccharicenans sp.]|jgi:bleomycin hydrolase|nr:peptidase C1 [Candidatus Saccharicenans sp.]HRD02728.1 C1 family peptidase [Candidatus Saccharicenans sp.]
MNKKLYQLLLVSLVVFSILWSFSCQGQKQEAPPAAVQKTVLQISEQEVQTLDEAIYKTREFNGRKREYLTIDFSTVSHPAAVTDFQQVFHLPPVKQHRTGTCWCFATTSFLESELKRLGHGEIKLSEMYTVYWQYVEKARRFIQEKGKSALGEGSEANAVTTMMKQYGAVPASAYTGLLPGQTEHDHSKLFAEIRNYLDFCQKNEYWDEEKALAYVQIILNKYLGEPPTTIEVNGQKMTPKEYLDNVLQLPLDDYVCFMSFKYLPFYTKGEYKAPDNWWHSQDYYNVPLDEFYQALVNSLEKGYSLSLGGDVSEPGISGEEGLAIIPTFDILPSLINQDSREFRFYNRTSTDDHAIHAVGLTQHDDRTWFLIKDSGGGAHRGPFKGYEMFRDDFVKLKMLTFMVHKDAVPDLLAKFEAKAK